MERVREWLGVESPIRSRHRIVPIALLVVETGQRQLLEATPQLL